MSSGKTETLGLNQWQLSDAFLMEEMNEDNRKVDAVVKTLVTKMEVEKIRVITTSAQAASVEIDVSNIDFSSYYAIGLRLVLYGFGTSKLTVAPATSQSARLTAGGTTVDGGINYIQMDKNPTWALLLPLKDGSRSISALSVGTGQAAVSTGVSNNSSFQTLKTLTVNILDPGFYISAGGKIEIWGVK